MIDRLNEALRGAAADLDSTLQDAEGTSVLWVLAVYHDGQFRIACNGPQDLASTLLKSASVSCPDLPQMPNLKGH